MKWVRGYFFLSIIGLIVCIVPFKALYTLIFVLNSYKVQFDPLFSTKLQKEVCTYISTTTFVEFCSRLCGDIKNQFPVIKNIECFHRNSNHALLVINAYKPLYLVNQDDVLLEQGVITSKKYFMAEGINDLYSLSIMGAQKNSIFSVIPRWLEDSPNLFEHYHIQWIDPTKIVLIDKQWPCFKVLCHYKNHFNSRLLMLMPIVLKQYQLLLCLHFHNI